MFNFRLLLLLFALVLIHKVSFPQKVTAEDLKRYYDKYYVKENIKLGSIYPVNRITKIIIINHWRESNYTLNKSELEKVKKALSIATSTGGLMLKPGHLRMNIEFNKPDIRTSDYIYMYNGSIHFDEGTDLKGKRFCGSFNLTKAINFDKFGE